jgi:uncharacterized membrane protein YfcA
LAEALQAAIHQPGLGILILAAVVAGLVRGFAGFGTAMVYIPIASQVVSPIWALATMVVMDVIGPLPNAPRAIRDGHPRDVLRLTIGLIVAMPLGVLVLDAMAPEMFRYAVSFTALALLALLIAGYRYTGELTRPIIFGTGGLGGFLGGCTGLAGPPVIMLYMASKHPASVVRANITLYLILADVLMLILFSIWGMITLTPLILGAALIIPYMLANIAGAALFRPELEVTYRRVAYVIIAFSALSGLPIWD